MCWVLELDDSKGPFQTKPFYDSMNMMYMREIGLLELKQLPLNGQKVLTEQQNGAFGLGKCS